MRGFNTNVELAANRTHHVDPTAPHDLQPLVPPTLEEAIQPQHADRLQIPLLPRSLSMVHEDCIEEDADQTEAVLREVLGEEVDVEEGEFAANVEQDWEPLIAPTL